MSPPSSWLITGGCGFLGCNLIACLLGQGGRGQRITLVDDLSVGARDEVERICPVVVLDPVTLEAREPSPDAPHVQLVVGDIRDPELAARATAGHEVVVHFAANTGVEPSVRDPMRDCTTNVVGTLNYLEAARHGGVQLFVFASSGAPIGECEPPLHEELPAHPVSPYGASKLAGEAYCSAYKRCFGLDTVVLRFSNVYGPLSGKKNSLVAKLIREALAGQPWSIHSDGCQTRDFLYVGDLIEAVWLAATRPDVGGEVFQIATNTETTVNDLAGRLARVLERHGVSVPEIRHDGPRQGDVLRNFADVGKARRMLGWEAAVALDEGLERTVRWFLKQNS